DVSWQNLRRLIFKTLKTWCGFKMGATEMCSVISVEGSFFETKILYAIISSAQGTKHYIRKRPFDPLLFIIRAKLLDPVIGSTK
ncbi:MAG: hypothetical protein WA869_28390, partial [Alloacidobacterium sp.]